MFHRLLSVLAITTTLSFAAMSVRAETAMAVFDFVLQDTSGEPRTPALDARLRMASALLRGELEEAGYAVLALPDTEHCTGITDADARDHCQLSMARKSGAALTTNGVVHKVSTLILYIRATVRDTATGQPVEEATVAIRGDNDRAWQHGVRYLVEHEFQPPPR